MICEYCQGNNWDQRDDGLHCSSCGAKAPIILNECAIPINSKAQLAIKNHHFRKVVDWVVHKFPWVVFFRVLLVALYGLGVFLIHGYVTSTLHRFGLSDANETVRWGMGLGIFVFAILTMLRKPYQFRFWVFLSICVLFVSLLGASVYQYGLSPAETLAPAKHSKSAK